MQAHAYTLSSFAELTTTKLYEILKLRSAVFVVEQNCVYQDMDDLDQSSLHLCQWHNATLIAYSRLLAPGLDFQDAAAIGRIITSPTVRRKGYGRPLIKKSIAECEQLWPGSPIKIHAQTYLLEFYQEFGFRPYGEEFLEDGLPHVFMERTIQS